MRLLCVTCDQKQSKNLHCSKVVICPDHQRRWLKMQFASWVVNE